MGEPTTAVNLRARFTSAEDPHTIPLTASIPPLAGHLYDVSGSYAVTFAPGFAIFALIALLLFFLQIPAVEPGTEHLG